jgi:hypothetical protein
MEAFAILNLVHVFFNAVLIIFWGRSPRQAPHVVGLVLGVMGVVVSVLAVAQVAKAATEWNSINNSSKSFYELHRSVFVGDISTV